MSSHNQRRSAPHYLAIATIAAVFACTLLYPLVAVHTTHAQGNDAQVDLIECQTYVGAAAQQPAAAEYELIQQQPVKLRCAYNVAPGAGATALSVNSDLLNWEARIVIYESRKAMDDAAAEFSNAEPNARTLQPYRGDLDQVGILKLEIAGVAPDAKQRVSVDAGQGLEFTHEVQKPNQFQAATVIVEAAASKDQHVEYLTATTERWQQVDNRVNRYVAEQQREGLPASEAKPIRNLLEAGYPNLAEQLLDSAHELTGVPEPERSLWQKPLFYIIGGIALALAIGIAAIIVIAVLLNPHDE